jgi:hypothetical protein
MAHEWVFPREIEATDERLSATGDADVLVIPFPS